jgi:hypothetical protein
LSNKYQNSKNDLSKQYQNSYLCNVFTRARDDGSFPLTASFALTMDTSHWNTVEKMDFDTASLPSALSWKDILEQHIQSEEIF